MAECGNEDNGGHPGPGLPPAEKPCRQRRQLRQAVDPARSEARPQSGPAKVSPQGQAADRSFEAAGNPRAQQCQDLRDYFFSLTSMSGSPSPTRGISSI